MSPTLWLPVAITLVAALAAGALRRRLAPPLAASVLTTITVISALAVTWGLALGAFGVLVQIPLVAQWVGWCRHVMPANENVPVPVGVLSLAALAVAGGRAWRWHRGLRRLLTSLGEHDGPVEIVAVSRPTAFAVPGDPGRIVVSRAMLDCLDERERQVLFAHEQAHLDHNHHRYVRLSELAAAAIPIVRPIAAQVRLATERWADETAAAAVGDRRLVAHAVGRAALAASGLVPAVALGVQSHVAERVEALLAPPPSRSWIAPLSAAAVLAVVMVALGSGSLQLHHLLAYATHVCRLY